MIGSVRLDGTTATMAIEGATDTEVFRAYVQRIAFKTKTNHNQQPAELQI